MLPLVFLLDAMPSGFWQQLDAVCAVADRLPADSADEDIRDTLQYCRLGVAPPFAAKSEAERTRRLTAVVAAAQIPPLAEPLPVTTPAVTNAIIQLAADELRRVPPPDLGLVGQKMVGVAIEGLCRKPDVKAVLPATCLLSGAVTLTTLRLAVLQDVVALVVTRAARDLAPSLRLLAEVLRTNVLSDLRVPDPLAQTLFTRFVLDGPRIDRGRDHYRNIVAEIAREQLGLATLTPDQLVATEELVEALRRNDPLQSMAAALRLSARLTNRADALAAVGPAVATATSILDAFGRASPRGVATVAIAELDKTSVPLTASEARAVRVAADLAEARNDSDLRHIARDLVLPLPPWVDRFAFDINIAPPVNKHAGGDSELSLNGDVLVGYNGDRIGFVASASSAYYDVSANGNSALTERYAGSLDVWGLIDLGKSVRLAPRLSVGSSYYGTLASDFVAGGQNRQTNQDSIFGRGVGMLGVRVEPGARFAFSAAAGIGGQYEDYFRVLQISTGEQGTTFNSATTVRYEGRLRAQLAVVPDIVSVRGRCDLQAFDMRRADQAVTYSVGRLTQAEQGVTEISQVELFARGFVDADVLNFLGFVPSAHGGVNVFSFSKNGVGETAVVPVFGVGIRRAAL